MGLLKDNSTKHENYESTNYERIKFVDSDVIRSIRIAKSI